MSETLSGVSGNHQPVSTQSQPQGSKGGKILQVNAHWLEYNDSQDGFSLKIQLLPGSQRRVR
jgi:hypothetical protein